MSQRTSARATTSRAAFITSAVTVTVSSRPDGGEQRHSAVSVPRAFFRYSMPRCTTMPRASSGRLVSIASPLVTSARLASATAWIEPR